MAKLIGVLCVAAVLAVGCAAQTAQETQPSEDVEPAPAETQPAVTMTATEADCRGVFAQQWNAYGWEDCLLGGLSYAHSDKPVIGLTLSEADATLLLVHVWRQYGSGHVPEFNAGRAEISHYCDSTSGACASEIRGTRYITFAEPELINATALLHETAHHLISVGYDEISGGHGMDFRCAAVELYGAYLPELVPPESLRQFREACEVPDFDSCRYDIASVIAAEEDLQRKFAEAADARTVDDIRRQMRGIEQNWQGDDESKQRKLAELEAEIADLLVQGEEVEADEVRAADLCE